MCNSLKNNLFNHRHLLFVLVKRDVLTRYRGAMFGVLWMFLSPLLMLAIFAFVFGQIFQARWPQQPDGLPFWLTLYTGLIVFNIFADAVSRAPASVRAFPNYVKKIIFPVIVLPLVPVGAGIAHLVFNLVILIVALAWVDHLSIGVMLFPLLLLPALLFAVGLSWFLAAWGVFIKDMSQIVPLFVQMMLFLSPVLYPITAVPEALRPVYRFNPLSSVIEAGRAAILELPIAWGAWVMALFLGFVACVLGYLFFHHSRDEFADVL